MNRYCELFSDDMYELRLLKEKLINDINKKIYNPDSESLKIINNGLNAIESVIKSYFYLEK